jgi:hypothetical protein
MASQSGSMKGSIKLLNGHHTQTGIETFKELERVQFTGSDAENVTWPSQGRQTW